MRPNFRAYLKHISHILGSSIEPSLHLSFSLISFDLFIFYCIITNLYLKMQELDVMLRLPLTYIIYGRRIQKNFITR